jgi:hypothetical protein
VSLKEVKTMKIQIVFQEDNKTEGVKKNDIFTYEKKGNYINTYANGVPIVDDFDEDYYNEYWLSNLINGLKILLEQSMKLLRLICREDKYE